MDCGNISHSLAKRKPINRHLLANAQGMPETTIPAVFRG
jgi:hypothetical protein